jgi:hypothetical protein
MPSFFASLVLGGLKALLKPLLIGWAAVSAYRGRVARQQLDQSEMRNKIDADLRNLDDADLDERLRRSMGDDG